MVDYQRPPFVLDETVLVMPEAIWPAGLPVDESMRRLPDADFALPANGKPVQTEFVIDQCPGLNDDWGWRQNLKAQQGGRQRLELECVREELEKFRPRTRQPLREAHRFPVRFQN